MEGEKETLSGASFGGVEKAELIQQNCDCAADLTHCRQISLKHVCHEAATEPTCLVLEAYC